MREGDLGERENVYGSCFGCVGVEEEHPDGDTENADLECSMVVVLQIRYRCDPYKNIDGD